MTIPDSVTKIGGWAFYGCSGLTSVTIPDSVTEIGENAFEVCSGLTSVTIPDSVTEIGRSAFEGCSGLTSVTIPSSVTTIGKSAFNGCSGLTSVTIPNSVTTIGESAFYGCSGLTSVTIPDSVTNIGGGAFSNCNSLTDLKVLNSKFKYQSINGTLYNKIGSTLICFSGSKKGSVTIPDSVTTIGEYAFNGCSGLTSVTIPDSVTKIGESAFHYCSGLTSVTIKAAAPPVCYESLIVNDDYWNSVYENFSVYNTLYVPMESVDLYKNASPWKKFKHIIGVDFSDKPIYHAEAKLYVLGTELQNKENELVTIYDATGKAVMRSDSSNISMETLEPGIYTIATTWGFFKYERCKPVYQAEAKLYVSGVVLQNKNNELVTIYDATGKAVMKSAASIISIEELPKGTYMVATIWGSFMIER